MATSEHSRIIKNAANTARLNYHKELAAGGDETDLASTGVTFTYENGIYHVDYIRWSETEHEQASSEYLLRGGDGLLGSWETVEALEAYMSSSYRGMHESEVAEMTQNNLQLLKREYKAELEHYRSENKQKLQNLIAKEQQLTTIQEALSSNKELASEPVKDKTI